MKRKNRSGSHVRAMALATGVLLLTACSPQYATRGNLPDDERLSEVIVGEVHAQDVAEILGTPSTFSSFGGESWYYISERVETFAFYEPKLLERRIIRVDFDNSGMVSAVDESDKGAGLNVQFVERTTPTAGHSLSFFEQIFGNLGRFNQEN